MKQETNWCESDSTCIFDLRVAEFNKNMNTLQTEVLASSIIAADMNLHDEPVQRVDPLIGLDASYSDFPEHPVSLFSGTFTTTSTYGNLTTDLWYSYLTAASTLTVGNKISNFRVIDTNLRVRIVVQGAPYAQGLVIVSFDPTPHDQGVPIPSAGATQISPPQKVRARLLPHILIDPSKSCTYDISLPCPTNWGVYTSYGGASPYYSYSVNYIVLNKIGSGTATEPTINYAIFCGLDKPRLSALTKTASVGEDEQTALSAYIGTITKLVNPVRLTIPKVSGTLTLFSDVARTTANFLKTFGYSKPRTLMVDMMYKATTVPALTTVDGKFDARTLAMREANSISIAPTDINLQSFDDQLYSVLARKKGLVAQFAVAPTYPVESSIGYLAIDPSNLFPVDSPPTANSYELTPLAFCTYPYAYWRGTISVTLEFICSVFHRATFLAAYTPNGGDTPSFNDCLTTVKHWQIQVSGNTQVCLDIPWSQPYQFARMQIPNASTLGNYMVGNGYLNLFCINPPVTNGSTDPVHINVYFHCNDLQVAVPNTNLSGRFSMTLTSSEGTLLETCLSKNMLNNSNFFGKYFGEESPTSVKELCTRMMESFELNDNVSRSPGAYTYILPALGLYHSTMTKATNPPFTFVNSHLSFCITSYVGLRGSINWDWVFCNAGNYISSADTILPIAACSAQLCRNLVVGYATSATYSGGFTGIPNGYGITVGDPDEQNNLAFTVPNYVEGNFRIPFPVYWNSGATTPNLPILQEEIALTINYPYNNTAQTPAVIGSVKMGLGDDASFVFYRGTPVMLFT